MAEDDRIAAAGRLDDVTIDVDSDSEPEAAVEAPPPDCKCGEKCLGK